MMRIKRGNKILVSLLIALILAIGSTLFAQKQYVSAPVIKEGLIRVLMSKRYRTRDIVQIIQEHGVNFRVTSTVEKQLIKAGARPGVISAARSNYRRTTPGRKASSIGNTLRNKLGVNRYQMILDRAVRKYDEEKNTAETIKILESAIKLQPKKPRAYQLMAYAYLYGYRDFNMAEKNMRKSINLGGSAVFRVRHSHNASFVRGCKGSLYISRGGVRYEGDDNKHTFDVVKSDIKKAKTLGGWGKFIRIKKAAFQIVIRDRTNLKKIDHDSYKFSPQTGKKKESKMIIRLIGKLRK